MTCTGPSTSSLKLILRAVPVTPSAFTVPSTRTTWPTRRSDSVPGWSSIVTVAPVVE